jgi:hypothetical protein
MQNKILVIYVEKENQKYDHYEVYPLSEKFTKEMLITGTEEYNADAEKDYTAKIYEDPVLIDFVSDVQASWQNKHVIENLKSICSDIESDICALESWRDDITDLLDKE